MSGRPYSTDELALYKRLRNTHSTVEIVEISALRFPPGRSKGAIEFILTQERKKGVSFKKVRHGNLKHDRNATSSWRTMLRKGMNYTDIFNVSGVLPAAISRAFAAESRGELSW